MTNDDDTPIIYNPEDVLKKEARGIGNADLGEVQEVSPEYIITQKGTLVVDKFYIPKSLVDRFDGNTVWFKVTEEDSNKYKKHTTKPLG
jgi:hypothetical protein